MNTTATVPKFGITRAAAIALKGPVKKILAAGEKAVLNDYQVALTLYQNIVDQFGTASSRISYQQYRHANQELERLQAGIDKVLETALWVTA